MIFENIGMGRGRTIKGEPFCEGELEVDRIARTPGKADLAMGGRDATPRSFSVRASARHGQTFAEFRAARNGASREDRILLKGADVMRHEDKELLKARQAQGAPVGAVNV